MITNPEYGWCNFELGGFKGTPSYLIDVPVELLDAFIDYYTNGYGVAVFDEEGSYFTLVMNAYNDGIFIIEEKDHAILHDLCDLKMNDLKEELISDIEKDIDGWVEFTKYGISQHKSEIIQRIEKLKTI